jgi:hypothetical protein
VAADSTWRGYVVVVLGLHAFVAQTHAAFLVPATVAVVLGLWWRWRALPRARIREASASVAVIALLWLPTAIDQIAGSHNLSRMAAVTAEHPRLGLTLSETLGVLVDRVGFGSAAVLALLVVGLAAARVRLRIEPGTWRSRLTSMAVVQLGATTLVLDRLDAPRDYLTAWIVVVALVAWLAVALAWLPAELPDRFRHVPLACAVVVAAVSGARQLSVMTVRMRKLEASESRRGEDVQRLLAQFDALRPSAPTLLALRVPEQWPVFAALVLQLHKREIAFVVEPKWRRMLGDGIPLADGSERMIELVERDGELVLLAEPTEPVRARIVDAVGVEGDVALLLDGDAPADGTHPSHANAVELLPGGFVTLQLDADAERLQLTGIGGCWFRVEGSWDGVAFEQVALTPRAGRGLRTRAVDLRTPQLRAYTFVRIVAEDGPWRFWLAELTPLRRPRADE